MAHEHSHIQAHYIETTEAVINRLKGGVSFG